MSQRLAKMIHPHTGEALRPLFTDKFGRVHWPMLGASGDDSGGSGDSGDEDDTDGDKDGDKSKKKDDDSSGGDDKDKSKSDDGKKYSEAEYQSVKERMQAADRRASEAEKKVRDAEDKDRSKVEVLERDLGEAKTKITDLEKVNEDLRFANAFALSNGYTWNDPEVVLDLLRKREDVTVEDGEVKGLEKALKDIAKKKPYLVKDGDDDGDDDKDDDDEDKRPPRSGSSTGSGKKKSQSKKDEAALRQKYRL